MTIRKKLIVSTIAASVAATAFAGLPLSNKGLAEKLGFNNTAYAATSSYDALVAAVKEWHDAFDTDGLAALRALRDEVNAVPVSNVKTALKPITDNFVGSLESDEIATIEALYLELLGFTYDADLSYLDNIRTNAAYKDVVKKLATGAGVQFTVEDVAYYALQVKNNLLDSLDDLSETQVKALATNPLDVLNLLQGAIGAVPDNGTAGKVKQVFTHYGLTKEEVKSAAAALVVQVDTTTLKNAVNAIVDAYLSTRTPSGGGGGGVIGGGEETGAVAPPKEVTDFINGIKDKLKNATDAEKAAILAAAVQQATALVQKYSNFDLSGDVKVTNGQASVQVGGATVLSAIAGIGEILKNVKELAPGVSIPAAILNLNFGNVAQDNVKIGLDNAVIQEAIKAGLGGINVSVSGLSAVLPVGGQFNGAVEFNVKTSKADSAATGGLKPVSDVFNFDLSLGGKGVTSFAQPIIVSIPLGNVEGVDQELLSLAKIVDGKLAFQGGRVRGNTIVEARDTFSQYVVVENKVSFTDTASVQTWAGRAIEVIAAKGAIEGKKAGVFAPKDKVTRAEFAKMLTRALDLDNSLATEGFADVKDSDWSAPYIGAAAKLGIIQGRSATKFDPNAPITRAEMATMIARALKVTAGAQDVADVNAALAGFKDASSISAALKAGVAFASKNGIVIGNNGKFTPNASATRAEAAVMIYRAVNFK